MSRTIYSMLFANVGPRPSSVMEGTGETNLRTLFKDAQRVSDQLDTFASTSDPTYQDNLRSAVGTFERCREIVGRISLFSPNETLEDISSGDLP